LGEIMVALEVAEAEPQDLSDGPARGVNAATLEKIRNRRYRRASTRATTISARQKVRPRKFQQRLWNGLPHR
jgi:hypothetical protein